MERLKNLVCCCALLLGVTEARPTTFWQITDLHLDSLYSVNGTRKEWCHANDSSGNDKLKPFGDYSCDPPLLLVESAFAAMKRIDPNPDFILWTGDNSPHWWPDSPDWDYIYKSLKSLSSLLSSYFPETPIIPVLGNHDSFPADYFVDDPNADLYSKYIEEGSWGDFLQGESRNTFKKCGYYTYNMNHTHEDQEIKFIVLNTNLYYNNKANISDNVDPCGQMKWYRNELLDTATKQIPTIVTAHVPPGYFEIKEMGNPYLTINNDTHINDMFVQLSSNPNENIMAHIYGHVHTDSFRLFMRDDDPVHVAFLAPSITPLLFTNPPGVNPGIRLYQYDLEDKSINNYWQYYLPLDNLTDDNDDEAPPIPSPTPPPIDRASGKKSLDDESEDPPASSSRGRRINSKFLDVDSHRRKRQADPIIEADAEEAVSTTDAPTGGTASVTEASEVPAVSTTVAPKQNETGQNETVTTPEPITTLPPVVDDDKEQQNATVVDDPDQQNATDTTEADNTKSDRSEQLDYLTGQWIKSYEAQKAFEIDGDLTPRAMYLAFRKMSDETSKVFNRYYKHNRLDHAVGDCNDTCKQLHLCAISCLTVHDYNECLHPRNDTIETKSTEMPTTTTTTTTTTQGPPHVVSFPGDSNVPKAEDHVYVARGVAISFSVLGIVAIGVIAFFVHRRIKKNRYRSQEFLLTDSVFRFDGYSQLDT